MGDLLFKVGCAIGLFGILVGMIIMSIGVVIDWFKG